MAVTKEEIAAAFGVPVAVLESTFAIGGRMAALGLEDAAVDSLALAEMQRILDGFSLALDTGAADGAVAFSALASARSVIAQSAATVTGLRSSGGDVVDGKAAVVTAAQAVGAAAKAVGAWAAAIGASVPLG